MNEENRFRKSGQGIVNPQPSTLVTRKWICFLGLLVLVTLWGRVPRAMGQEQIDNRRLEREQAQRAQKPNKRRVALVIGNSAYQKASRLTNPLNDATDMAVAL